ncbi:unnamed protein product, partial [Scytosiphon promiscuus]
PALLPRRRYFSFSQDGISALARRPISGRRYDWSSYGCHNATSQHLKQHIREIESDDLNLRTICCSPTIPCFCFCLIERLACVRSFREVASSGQTGDSIKRYTRIQCLPGGGHSFGGGTG